MEANELWQEFIESNPLYEDHTFDSWSYGAAPDELAELTLKGTKTATASGHALYEAEGESLPSEGQFSVILDEQGAAVCIIRTEKVYATPFNEVSERHAYKEGEGDRSLDYWLKVHLEFFEPAYQEANLSFDGNSLIVCEEFELVHPLQQKA